MLRRALLAFIMLCAARSNAFRFLHAPIGRRALSKVAAGAGSQYLHVPFDQRDAVKSLGAKWDVELKKWYIPNEMDAKPFQQWRRVYLRVPFADKDKVKALGAMWDAAEGKWFASGNMKPFLQWIEGIDAEAAKAAVAEPEPVAAPEVKVAAEADPLLHTTVLLLDCDTNGLPTDIRSAYPPYTSLKSYDTARIVQLSFALCERSTFDPISTGSFIVQSDGFPIDNTEFHGITQATSVKKGVPFKQAAAALLAAAQRSQTIVAHNAEFVVNVLKSELFRHGMVDEAGVIEHKAEVCTMLGTRDALQLKDKLGNPKAVSLKELVKFALKEDLPQMHNSEVDVQYLRRALARMSADKTFSLPSPSP